MSAGSKQLVEALSLGVAVSRAKTPDLSDSLVGTAECLESIGAAAASEFRPALDYQRARCYARIGMASETIELCDELSKSKRPLPEALWLNIQITAGGTDPASSERRWKLEERLAELLPISLWRALLDGRVTERYAEKHGIPLADEPCLIPEIPIRDVEKLLGVASRLRALDRVEAAASAYREALYGGFRPPEFPAYGAESWVSPEAAPHWLRTAELERALGRRGPAFQAAMLAVCGDGSLHAAAVDVVAPLAEKLRPSLPEPRTDRAVFAEIAELYRACNLHPRALDFVSDRDRAAELTAGYRELVADYARHREKAVHLYGRLVAKTKLLKLAPQ